MNLFDHVNAIYQNQDVHYFDTLSEEDKKAWSTWVVNRTISMNMDYVSIVNELQQYMYSLSNNDVYLFYSQILPKKKQFNKYIKKSKKTETPEWLVELVQRQYSISIAEAEDYIAILQASPKLLTDFLEDHGIEENKFTEAGI